jgi:hypothetical protein
VDEITAFIHSQQLKSALDEWKIITHSALCAKKKEEEKRREL